MSELVTLKKVKSFLKITTTANDELLNSLIVQYSTLIESYCKRKFSKAEYTETYDGTGSPRLFLKQYPIGSVSSLSVDEITCDSADYVIYADEGIIELVDGSLFTKDKLNVAITYEAGYEEIPPDIELCCQKLVALAFKETDSDRIGIASQSFGDQSTSFVTSEFPEDIKKILNSYKKILI
jgi:hypothetical protein